MKNVLIIDDSKFFLNTLERILSPHYQILGKAQSGTEGLEKYKLLHPDIVLMDITMPNLSGKECLQQIIDFDPHACIIMVSSIGDETTQKECINIGAKAFVSKEAISLKDKTGSTLIKTLALVEGQIQLNLLKEAA